GRGAHHPLDPVGVVSGFRPRRLDIPVHVVREVVTEAPEAVFHVDAGAERAVFHVRAVTSGLHVEGPALRAVSQRTRAQYSRLTEGKAVVEAGRSAIDVAGRTAVVDTGVRREDE